nr:3248_t:CDS:10 [Entrophospora candida]
MVMVLIGIVVFAKDDGQFSIKKFRQEQKQCSDGLEYLPLYTLITAFIFIECPVLFYYLKPLNENYGIKKEIFINLITAISCLILYSVTIFLDQVVRFWGPLTWLSVALLCGHEDLVIVDNNYRISCDVKCENYNNNDFNDSNNVSNDDGGGEDRPRFSQILKDERLFEKFKICAASFFCIELILFIEEYQYLKSKVLKYYEHTNDNLDFVADSRPIKDVTDNIQSSTQPPQPPQPSYQHFTPWETVIREKLKPYYQRFYQTFLDPSAGLAINVDDSTLRNIKRQIVGQGDYNIDMFEHARMEVLHLLYVLRWFGKNGKRYDYNNNDDNNRTSTPSQYLKTRHKVEWIKQHETSSRGNSWTNSRDFGSIMQYRQEFDQFAWKKHHSLPIPPLQEQKNNYYNDNINQQYIYSSSPPDIIEESEKIMSSDINNKVETPAKIIVATKENLSRNSRSSIQSIQLHSIKQDDGVDDNNHSSSSSNHENHNHVRNRNSSNRSSNIPSSNTSNKSLNGIPSNTSNNRNSSNRNSLNKHSLNRDSIRSSISTTSSTSHPSSSSAKTTGNERKNIILKRNFARCNTCRKSMMEGGYTTQWCRVCESKRFEQNFGTWTSGNDNIDCFILETQLNAQSREKWDKKIYQYVCCGEWVVALKRLYNSKYVTTDFFNEMSIHLRSENNSGNYFIRYYGITQDPNTKDYMIVEQFARNGNLQSYIKKNRKTLTWQKRLDILFSVATGINRIHSKKILHRNIHSGNILIHSLTTTLMSDLGLSSRADKGTSSTNINDIGGSHKSTTGVAVQFNKAEEIFNNNVGGLEEEEEEVIDPGAIYISRFLKFSELQEPTIIFTRTNDPIEHLSVKNHIILETQLCNLKYEILQTENTKVAAEVYEILKYL